MARKRLLAAIALILATLAAGCLPLMIGSLGYQAYEYEKTGTIPGMPQMPHDPPPQAPKPQATPLEDVE